MKLELEDQLQRANKKQLHLLIQELAVRHPPLKVEIVELLEKVCGLSVSPGLLEATVATDSGSQLDEDVTEDWDFSGDELMAIRPLPQPVLLPLDQEGYRRRIEAYLTRLNQGESPQAIFEDLNELLDEAETRAEHHDYQGAMELYALVLDERLAERNPALVHIFDKAIDDIMPILETLLSEASSNILFEASSLAPLLTLEMRQEWLKRLFALWLKRLNAHHVEENVPEIMLNVAWSEDVALLRHLIKGELQLQPSNEHSNIVDFTQQYRTRTLEKFLKELPRT